MNPFAGFPARMGYTAMPNVFFADLLPQIDDLAELKATLYVFHALYRKKGYPRYVTYHELLGNLALPQGLGKRAPEALRQGLERAVRRGTLLELTREREDRPEALFLLNTEADRKAAARLQSGELPLPEGRPVAEAPLPERPNIFTLYEENIGLLTPLIADQLREAEKAYPASWIEEAFKEAVALNKRSWRYIQRVLERWAREGKSGGEPGGDSKEAAKARYLRGKYGRLVDH